MILGWDALFPKVFSLARFLFQTSFCGTFCVPKFRKKNLQIFNNIQKKTLSLCSNILKFHLTKNISTKFWDGWFWGETLCFPNFSLLDASYFRLPSVERFTSQNFRVFVTQPSPVGPFVIQTPPPLGLFRVLVKGKTVKKKQTICYLWQPRRRWVIGSHSTA